jgi:hypothetical protein
MQWKKYLLANHLEANTLIFFLEQAGELHIIVLRRKRAEPVLDHLTNAHTHT